MDTSADIDPMAEINELDDLDNLFEFGEIDLNTITDTAHYGDPLSQQHGTHPNTPFPDIRAHTPLPGTNAHDFGGNATFSLPQSMDQHGYAKPQDPRAPTSNPYTTESMYQPSPQHGYNPYPSNFAFQPQSGFPPNHHVPPTPNSYEMHGETAHFMQQQQQHPPIDPQQQAILEQRFNIRKDDAIAFTPMVSPAGTPQYNIIPEFTTPGAYFSPLTSPMLHAQNQQRAQLQHAHQQGYLTNPSTAPSSNTNSPVDPGLDVEMLDGMSLPASAGPPTRKSKRKPAPSRAASAAKVKQSPAGGAQKRKSMPVSSNAPASGAEILPSQPITPNPATASFHGPSQFDSSETGSISPEPFGDTVMGPPPRPGSSLTQSPALLGQQPQGAVGAVAAASVGAAATPKSLLTMRGAQQQRIHSQQTPAQHAHEAAAAQDFGSLDDLALPEAANAHARGKPSLSQINTQLLSPAGADNGQNMSARKTPKLGALSTPASARSGSAVGSPLLAGSPMAASTPAAILKDKKDARSGRSSNKKRGSISANGSKLVSPALVPKISPSIKPLLPEGTPLNTATQAMLLASKSNYQNLLEGNHLPGVTYPDSLSTGLTSKRTSHKVAEQGRRNRINEALKEMQSLIPKTPASKSGLKEENADAEAAEAAADADPTATTAGGNKDDSKEDSLAKSNSSKAATVELANEYIKKMQKDNAERDAEVLQLKRENDELRKKLAGRGQDGETTTAAAVGSAVTSGSGSGSGSGSSASPETEDGVASTS